MESCDIRRFRCSGPQEDQAGPIDPVEGLKPQLTSVESGTNGGSLRPRHARPWTYTFKAFSATGSSS